MIRSFVFSLLFGALLAACEDSAKFNPISAEDKDNCPSVRNVKLGIYGVYDISFIQSRERKNASENITDYLSLLVGTTAQQHFRNISCTNISLVLVGASPLENSSAVLKLDNHRQLNIGETLEAFKEYSLERKEEFGHPDVTALFTDLSIVNKSKECKESYNKSLSSETERIKFYAYCSNIPGGAFYKGICGNNSVVIVKDNGGVYEGQTALAKGIARLFGVNYDALREEEDCNDYHLYLMGTTSGSVISPYLSRCGETELKNFIDSAGNTTAACWKDTPKAAVTNHFQTPHEFFQSNDFCSRYRDGFYKCPDNETIPDDIPDGECTEICCKPNSRHRVTDAFTTPYGKRCENGTGMCYYNLCIE